MQRLVTSKLVVLGVTCIILLLTTVQATSDPSATVTRNMASMPMPFTENMGQWPDSILFRADAGGATMWFTKDGIYYQFTRRISGSDEGNPPPARGGVGRPDRTDLTYEDVTGAPQLAAGSDRFDTDADSVEILMVKATFVGVNSDPEVVTEEMLDYKCNYFLGNDPAMWRTDVPNYTAVSFKNIYPGIDLKFSGAGNGQVQYELVAASGADLSQFEVAHEGEVETSLDAEGRLVATTAWGDRLDLLGSSDATNGTASPRLVAVSDNSYGLEAANLSQSENVALVYSTYLGGSDGDYGPGGIAVDGSGCAYVTGYTYSSDFPTQNAYDANLNGYHDVFVTKFSAAGNTLVYSTYLGGSGGDYGYGLAVDGSGCAYVAGRTYSSDFPTLNAYDASFNGGDYDVFVTKFSAAGNTLVYSTYLGGSSSEWGYGLAVDGSGCAYVTGGTSSSDFPTLNAYDASYNGGWDIFVTKFSAAGNTLVYSTYLGGTSDGYVGFGGIAVDGSGCAYVTGGTSSSDFPTLNAYDASYNGDWDAFVTKFSAAGNTLVYSTYLGGSSSDGGDGLAVDGSGCAYVTGLTYSCDFPTLNAYDASFNGTCGVFTYDVFVTKFSAAGNTLVYSTYLGGSSCDYGYGLAVDGSGCAYVTGSTYSSDFPTLNAYDASSNGDYDAFVTKFSAAGNTLVYSTYLGGSSDDYGYGLAVDGSGCAYVTGWTESPDFPTLNAYDASNNGDWDAFVTKLSAVGGTANDPPVATIDDISPNPASQPDQVTFSGHGTDADGSVVGYNWRSSIDGQLSTEASFATSSLSVGTHTITFKVKDDSGAWSAPATAPLEVSEDQSFEFIHITDIHVGACGAEARFEDMVDVINSLDPAPAFVVMTGDLVNDGCHPDIGITQFEDFIASAAGLDMGYYTSPGNHESYPWWNILCTSENYVSQLGPLNWQASPNGINLISLWSGYDESLWDCGGIPWVTGDDVDNTGEGSGLTNDQKSELESWLTSSPDMPAILFMHHPIVSYRDRDNCTDEAQDEGSNGCITQNRHEVFSLLQDPNGDGDEMDAAKLVLVGHHHQNHVYESDDVHHPSEIWGRIETQDYSDDLPLHVMTRDVRDHMTYRRIGVNGNNITVYPPTTPYATNKYCARTTTSAKNSPTDDSTLYPAARLHAYDFYGNHVGPNDTGGIDLEITGALYYPNAFLDTLSGQTTVVDELISLYVSEDEYRYELEAVAECVLSVEGELSRQDGTGTRFYYDSIAVVGGSKITAFVTGDSIDPLLYLDYDGDGTSEAQVQPDSVVSYGFLCGDIDGNGTLEPDIADLIYLVTYMFQDGPAPPAMEACDMDGNSTGPDIADLIWMVTYMFQDGPSLQCP